jgi:sporulation protein YlmC with PRC-barrel domain
MGCQFHGVKLLPSKGVVLRRVQEVSIMAQNENPHKLLRLSDTQLTVADPAEDVRGRNVIDKNGERIGEVSDLIVDDRETRVRFLEVASGGLFGLGRQKSLIPVDAIVRINDEAVYINQTRQRISEAPPYDPDLINEEVGDESYYGHVYRHYGYPPYWGPGYVYPHYPFYHMPPV